MNQVFQLVFGITVLSFFVWLLIPSRTSSTLKASSDEEFIDPENSRQIGLLVGMTGGSIPDAAVMRFALQRFQQIHGRLATTREIGVVLGLINSQRK
ncbi:MAG: hypothetical protein WCJ21_03635 [Planctomycetota bacterium]